MLPRRFASFQRQIYGSAVILSVIVLTYGALRTALPGRAITGSTSTVSTAPIDPTLDILASAETGEKTVVLAGGCFWGMEAVFEHLKGVSNVVSGFSGGSAATANYAAVSMGATEHAEAVQITYDPSQITYGQLLKVYFFVAHNPTELNRQGPDVGTQYRSAIFFANDEEKQVAQAYIDQLNNARIFDQAIVTQLAPLTNFYAAEDYHQEFVERHPNHPYVVIHDLPKLEQLRQQFPDLYQQ